MSETAATTLSMTPVAGTLQDIKSRIGTYLSEQHKPSSTLPQEGRQLMVNVKTRRVTRALPTDLSKPIIHEPEGFEYWRSVSVDAHFDTTSTFVDFCVREVDDDQTYVELWLPTRVFQCVFREDFRQKEFNHDAKSDLMRLFIGVAKALGAAGFGYRLAADDVLFGPLTIATLRDYVEIGNRWFPRRQEFQLRIAGVAASYIEDGQFEYDFDDHPRYYRQNGYYIYDTMWPR